ncbi:CMP-N-acetylneuraminate-beta-galactosamide-alpha-2,3-sialyltransferase 1-like [Diadema antillarum]|uniref:CMP-N-acetylneuraminate-beta-galactosamide- alpha-2,3-sialyltransferase 1-like n=1 Tax=Diadema antillarum TaxID=105358 RepID=UPI003A85DF13
MKGRRKWVCRKPISQHIGLMLTSGMVTYVLLTASGWGDSGAFNSNLELRNYKDRDAEDNLSRLSDRLGPEKRAPSFVKEENITKTLSEKTYANEAAQTKKDKPDLTKNLQTRERQINANDKRHAPPPSPQNATRKTRKRLKLDDLPFLKGPTSLPNLCPKSIQRLTWQSKWFGKRYKKEIKLFVDLNDIDVPKIFTKLQNYRLPFGFRGINKTKLEKVLKHPDVLHTPLFSERERPTCLRCAVVGSGGVLNGSEAGKEIDSHDLVFRANRALSVGRFAMDVGVKTDIYLFYPESMHIGNVLDENATFVYAMFKPSDVERLYNITFPSKATRKVSSKQPPPLNKLKVLHPGFQRYVHTRYLESTGLRPTTGATLVMLATHICDDVTIYGFGYDVRFTLHYYDKSFVRHNKNMTKCHDTENERDLWDKLHDVGVIRLFKRDIE